MKLTHKKSKYFKTAQEEMIDLCKKKITVLYIMITF